MTNDTKVLSKIMEILIIPIFKKFAKNSGYELKLPKEQNFYPDLTFIKGNKKFAVDIKTSYRKNKDSINGMTLGAFTGYFRDRTSTKNISYPYNEYESHFVLGIIYTRIEDIEDDNSVSTINDLEKMQSVANSFEIFIQEKFKIAIDRPGSGNTKNIGGVNKITDLINGNGPFTKFKNGEDVFNDYWQRYLTKDMAKQAELTEPYYKNLNEYKIYRNIK